jgi:hypothetical protein
MVTNCLSNFSNAALCDAVARSATAGSFSR